MPDITMCPGGDCPKREGCYRFKAKPAPMLQSYFVTPPYGNEGCSYFDPLRYVPPKAEVKNAATDK